MESDKTRDINLIPTVSGLLGDSPWPLPSTSLQNVTTTQVERSEPITEHTESASSQHEAESAAGAASANCDTPADNTNTASACYSDSEEEEEVIVSITFVHFPKPSELTPPNTADLDLADEETADDSDTVTSQPVMEEQIKLEEKMRQFQANVTSNGEILNDIDLFTYYYDFISLHCLSSLLFLLSFLFTSFVYLFFF